MAFGSFSQVAKALQVISKKSKKAQRALAVEREVARRFERRRAESPIERDRMLDLFEYVGRSVVDRRLGSEFEFAREWAVRNSVDFRSLAAFFSKQRIVDDWSLLMEGDPFELFGSSATRCSWMPMEQEQLDSLLNWLDAKIEQVGCQHDHRLTKEWLARHKLDVSSNVAALMTKGGFCDCEVLFNIEPEGIYPG